MSAPSILPPLTPAAGRGLPANAAPRPGYIELKTGIHRKLLNRLNLWGWGGDCGFTSTPSASLAVIAASTAIIATLSHFYLRRGADFGHTLAFNLGYALFKNGGCLRALCLNGGSLRLFGALFGLLFGTFRA